MTTTIYTEGDSIHIVMARAFEAKAITDSVAEAAQLVAKKFAEENMDKIMAQMDLRGLANLVAIYASKKLAEGTKE